MQGKQELEKFVVGVVFHRCLACEKYCLRFADEKKQFLCSEYALNYLLFVMPVKFFSNQKTIWILLGLFAMLLSSVLPATFVEQFYSRGFFRGVRWFFTGLNSWLPFASVYVLFFVLLGWLGYRLVRFFRSELPWSVRLVKAFTALLAFAGGVIFFFQLLWGFNYSRKPLESTLDIQPEPLTISELKTEMDATTADVLRIRGMLPASGDGVISSSFLPPDLETTMRNGLKELLHSYDYPTPGMARARQLWPKGLLLRISTAGVYIPFTGEGNVDAGLHFLQLPFVMAHELSHAYGFGDEGTCNFLAYLTCIRSENQFLNYVGYLYYWRYVASEYRSVQPEEFKMFWENLPQGLKADLQAIKEEMDKYPDIFPDFRDATYNAYLHAQGIHDGMKNYDRVVMMVHAWRKKAG